MDIESITRQFVRIGAELDVGDFTPIRRGSMAGLGYTLDVSLSKQREAFQLAVQPQAADQLEFLALDVQPRQRHLLLLARDERLPAIEQKRRFLCGHDERHWFVAPLPDRGITSVREAFEILKPDLARLSQARLRVRNQQINQRHNPGFIRQGEWFFIPQPRFKPPSLSEILHNEPISRGRGKPHWVESLWRDGGEKVYVSDAYPAGLTERQYERLLQRKPQARNQAWTVMRRNPQVYALGKVRHPDHHTIELPFWHLVVLSGERPDPRVVFLD
jgi:hypothetical protein